MKPGLLPAKRHSMPSTNVTMEQANGMAASGCILGSGCLEYLVRNIWCVIIINGWYSGSVYVWNEQVLIFSLREQKLKETRNCEQFNYQPFNDYSNSDKWIIHIGNLLTMTWHKTQLSFSYLIKLAPAPKHPTNQFTKRTKKTRNRSWILILPLLSSIQSVQDFQSWKRYQRIHPSISGWQSEGWSCVQIRHGHNCVSMSDVESSNGRSRRKKTWSPRN